MRAKTCKQCGELKPIEQFRQYYGDRKGHYTRCLTCEQINNRAKYLRRKGSTMSSTESEELAKIETLYEAQRAIGLQPPRDHVGRKAPLAASLDDMISKYAKQASEVREVTEAANLDTLPKDLSKWLTEPLTEEPEYYQDDVYEKLTAAYRPIIRIDPATMLPVYDETYSVVLNKILSRFDEYEDSYYNKD